ncbi:SDR family oxidoreductase [Panacibacter sp. DH6]|uniref:SDR family oxidoreductase n=1 Tax=Panacibacter microcysteis TaxID=2793269 RepID=A0A931E6I8_9BACT|nr:glucose 1-dehydrogenase [Panacibacter microcysteis]MBG9374656.1 SDR family oxidoreductase [Panacibacter microcysteis]
MENIFNGKVAVVTGAGSGIGEAAAVLYARYGAKVIVSDIQEAGGTATVAAIEAAGGQAHFIQADVSDAAACEMLIRKSAEKYGAVDIAFNNAGIGGEINPVADMSLEAWHKVINVNLNSVFYCMKYELQQMTRQGSGVIVNMSSILGKVAFANSAAYVAAKHGVVGLSQNAAVEYAKQGIRVNVVGPAFINTPLLSALDENVKKALVQMHPAGRLGEAGEVAELVIWLSSDKASFVTGNYYAVDGGYLAV